MGWSEAMKAGMTCDEDRCVERSDPSDGRRKVADGLVHVA